MPPTDICFPSPLEIFLKLRNIVVTEDLTDDESDMEDTISNMEDFETSSEGDLEIGEEMSDDESDENNLIETPLTSLTNNQEDRNPLVRRLVFAARRLFSPDNEEDASDSDMEYPNYLNYSDDDLDT